MIGSFGAGRALKARRAAILSTHRFLASGPVEERHALGGVCDSLCAPGGYLASMVAERRPDRSVRIAVTTGPSIDIVPESLAALNDPSHGSVVVPLKKGRAVAIPVPVDGERRMVLVISSDARDAFGPEEVEEVRAVASRLGDALSSLRLAARFDSLKKVYDDQSAILDAERDFSGRLLDLVPVPVVQVGPEGEIRTFNRKIEALTGYRASEVLNRRMADVLLPEADRSGFRRMLVELFIGRRPGEDLFPLLTRSSGPIRVKWEFSPIRDPYSGKVVSVLGCGMPTNVSDTP